MPEVGLLGKIKVERSLCGTILTTIKKVLGVSRLQPPTPNQFITIGIFEDKIETYTRENSSEIANLMLQIFKYLKEEVLLFEIELYITS